MKDAIIKPKEMILRGLGLGLAVLISVGTVQVSFADTADEGNLTVNGKLKIVQIDNEPGAAEHGALMYLLEDDETHKTFTLNFGNKRAPGHLRSGMKITARGKSKGQELLLAADGDGSQSITVTSAPAPMVAGDQKTLVIVANLADASVSCSAESLRNVIFDSQTSSVDALYRETSHGAISFSGQVVGPYALNHSSESCSSSLWADAADAAARADGVNVDSYSRKVYVLPGVCSVAGLGEVGTNPSRAWVYRCDLGDVFAHELGHNLGMWHASTPSAAYGDLSDIMGAGGRGMRQINAPHKEQMGWLPSQEVTTVTTDGTYEVAPLELNPLDATTTTAIKIFKPDTSEHYYVSYRQGIGFDENLRQYSYLDRTSVHQWNAADNTKLLAVLSDGESFVDTANGITVTQTNHVADHGTVQVRFDNPCRPSLPSISLSPVSQNAGPGSVLNYGVSITNADNTNCPTTAFDLNPSVPYGWTASISPSSILLLPGTSGQATLSVTSLVTSTAGNYVVTADVKDANQPARDASASATYSVVIQSDTTPPTAPSGLSAAARRKGVSLSWNPSQDNIGVSGYHVFRNGVIKATVTALSWVDSSTTTGAGYAYFVEAFDAAKNLSPPSNTATVASSNTGGSGSGSGGGKGGSKP